MSLKNTYFRTALKAVFATALALVICAPIAYADTNGSEIQITDQPDQLILQLGPKWAGVEFELKTDAGVFPIPVVVDQTGILKMDLGGSRTYILSSFSSAVAVPEPLFETEDPAADPDEAQSVEPDFTPAADVNIPNRIPTLHLVVFLGGLAVSATGLILMRVSKRRRRKYYYDDDE